MTRGSAEARFTYVPIWRPSRPVGEFSDDHLRKSHQPGGKPRASDREFGIRPEIEIFDLSHIHAARKLLDGGLIDESSHAQFVLGVKNALPAEERLLDILLSETRRLLPEATWTAAGIGRFQVQVMEWALARTADAVRTGLEDNIRITKDRLAASNAELVELAVMAVERHGRRAATPSEARQMLGLRNSR